MSEFSVDLDQLDNVVSQLQNLNGFVTDHLTDLEQKIAAIHTGGQWTGVTAEAHREAHEIWSKGAKEINDAIATMAAAGKTAHAAYTDAGTANGDALRGH